MSDDESYPKSFGPYLRYAISAGFRNFALLRRNVASVDRKPHSLFFLVKFHEAGKAGAFKSDLLAIDPNNPQLAVEFGPEEDNARHVTMIADKAVLEPRAFSAWNKHVSKVELSLPIAPTSPDKEIPRNLIQRWSEDSLSSAKLLIGVLDDGCPFAAAEFLRTLNPARTRVRAIWDQDETRKVVTINGREFGRAVTDFNFGREYLRESGGSGGPIGLNEWIQRYTIAPTNIIAEDQCYADADFRRLAPSRSHGAHVMDVIAGRVPTSSRIGPTKPNQDHRDPPSWQAGNPATDPACDADVVFVQFPESCMRDATGVWLKAYVVRGIYYIMSCADPQNTKDVIVNLSYGPTTGPHDGTHELETALAELVAEFDGSPGKPRLQVVLAAGNSYLTAGHVQYVRNAHHHHDHVEWKWRLPPDNTVLCFAEIWMDSAYAQNVNVTLTSPSGVVYNPTPPPLPPPAPGNPPPFVPAGLDVPIAGGNNDTMWRLQVEPTVVAPNVTAAEHGDYTIRVSNIPHGAVVDAYIARSDPNMGVVTGAKLSHFVDAKWQQTRAAEASCKYVHGEFSNHGSLVHRLGTLNGIATDTNARIHVAGGDMLMDGRKAPYASAGPARGNPGTRRTGPDYALFCDENYALEGVLAGGTRSGVVFRLIGTSAAAPQLARQIAKVTVGLPFPHPTRVPSPNDIVEIEKRGGGDVEPP
jgi:hypothetical protein